MIDPIYETKGAAKEYAKYALNLYTGCPHKCPYCYVPQVLHITKEKFHSYIWERFGILVELKKQLDKGKFTEQLIHLCFTCDPYPLNGFHDTTTYAIQLIKDSGNYVQILTKAPRTQDFPYFDENDWFGVTLTGENNDNAMIESDRIDALKEAWNKGINTWISFEPVLNPEKVLEYIEKLWWVDKMAVGKLNYKKSYIDWKAFTVDAQKLLKQRGKEYVIKDSLKKYLEG
ncbi:MAG: radical SAM protein [Campylobacteraceae bacterium]|jgi:DNA repair photolyase|nr:radical SAM protein [Campylobacteraceae bacterium]